MKFFAYIVVFVCAILALSAGEPLGRVQRSPVPIADPGPDPHHYHGFGGYIGFGGFGGYGGYGGYDGYGGYGGYGDYHDYHHGYDGYGWRR